MFSTFTGHQYNFYDLYRSTFKQSELGRIKNLLALQDMAQNFGLVKDGLRSKLGRKLYFTPEGKVALMFLKMLHRSELPETDGAVERQYPLSAVLRCDH